ncbi:MAG TPA: hypothetical protein VJ208_01390, partial [Candidatus Nanoarchaeia archaeon]|nr:hypothetical protein [Candidatus Nanoarchaeia archaeon]
MKEYYIIANSFAAPFVSDTSTHWQRGKNPFEALQTFVKEYKHPCGLFSAHLYEDANAESKNKQPLVKWHSNAARNLDN